MTVSMSITVILVIAVYLLCRYAQLRPWQAVVCILCGFYLASSSLAPYISQFTSGIIHAL